MRFSLGSRPVEHLNNPEVERMFLKNAWGVACTPDEIVEKPLGRIRRGESMLFDRAAGGTVVGFEDSSPLRGAPLPLGCVGIDVGRVMSRSILDRLFGQERNRSESESAERSLAIPVLVAS